MATILRSLLKDSKPDIDVIENIDGITSDNLGKAAEIFKKLSEVKNQKFEEKNASIFYNWILCQLYSCEAGESIGESGTSALSRDTIKTVLASISKHPMWRGSKIEVTSKEGYVVILGNDGSIR